MPSKEFHLGVYIVYQLCCELVIVFCVVQVCDGPQLCVRLLANITTPAVELSTDYIDFGLVKCGECNIVSVQLYNAQLVTCHWDSTDSADTTARKKRKVAASTKFLECS